jgi:hypothetical protein
MAATMHESKMPEPWRAPIRMRERFRATLSCLDLPKGLVSNSPLKKAPTRSRGFDGVAQRARLLKQLAPWDGSSGLPLDRSLSAVGLACARREEGKGISLIRLPSKR